MVVSVPMPIVMRVLSFLFWAALFLHPSCLQLESSHTFTEEEDVKARYKDLHRYYEDLQEAIRREQYHIKLLRDALDIKLTSEQALAEQIDKKQKDIEIKKKDLKALEDEIKSLDAQVKQQAGKRQSTQAALDAERKKTTDLEKSIRLEAARTERARLELVQTEEAGRKVEDALSSLKQKVAAKKKEVAELDALAAELDTAVDTRLAAVLDRYQKRIAKRVELQARHLDEVKNSLTSAALALERLRKGVAALQEYYQAKEAARTDLDAVQEGMKQLLDSIRAIQEVFENPAGGADAPSDAKGASESGPEEKPEKGGRVKDAAETSQKQGAP